MKKFDNWKKINYKLDFEPKEIPKPKYTVETKNDGGIRCEKGDEIDVPVFDGAPCQNDIGASNYPSFGGRDVRW